MIESISVTELDESINICKLSLNNENSKMGNEDKLQMIWLDHIEKGLIFLNSINSEKFEKLLTSEDFLK